MTEHMTFAMVGHYNDKRPSSLKAVILFMELIRHKHCHYVPILRDILTLRYS